ncbi:MAG: hypothetical protein NC131_12875 [Roseburia sp.]|nr:hypothetical protein [Roseburia sp.]
MQGDFIEKEDDRAVAGYGSCLLVDENNDGFYSLVIPLETVPSVAGEPESFEYNLLTARGKGKVQGKMELDDASVDFLWTRENILRLKQLENRTLSYATFDKNFVFMRFTAQLSFRRNDAEADVMRGSLTLTPLSLGEVEIDGRDYVRQTLDYSGTIPDSVTLTASEKTKTIDIAVSQADANATFDIAVEGSSSITGTYTDGKLTIASTATASAYATLVITAKSAVKMTSEGNTDKNKYAPWISTIAVSYAA